MILLVDVYGIFDNNQNCITCIGDGAFAIITMNYYTYYMFDPHSYVIGFQNDKEAAV